MTRLPMEYHWWYGVIRQAEADAKVWWRRWIEKRGIGPVAS
jgi:hypothetical protein